MPRENTPSEYKLGRGKVFIDLLDADDNPTGERYLGNTPTFEMTPEAEEIEHHSSSTATADLDASDVIRTSLMVHIVGDQFSKENVALCLFGDTATYTQTSGSASDEEITGVLQDHWYDLEYRDVSSVVVTGPTGTPEYTETDDYVVDATNGRLYIVPGGAISDDSDLEVDYDYGTLSLDKSRGMNQSAIKAAVRFISDNARGKNCDLKIWKVSFKPSAALGFISDEYAQWELEGKVESDAANHPDNPHYDLIWTS